MSYYDYTIDGLQVVPWIKQERARTGCDLKTAKDRWDALKAAGKTSSMAEEPGVCTVIEADIVNNRLVIQMLSDDYSVAPGKYKLVRVS